MATMNVRDADGITQTVEKPLAPGRAAETAARPVVLSTEDKTALDAVAQTLQNGATITQDAGPSWTPGMGVSGAAVVIADASAQPYDVTDAPASGQFLLVDELVVSVAAALQVTFKEETSGTVLWKLHMAANTTVTIQPKKAKLPTADRKLQVETSGAGEICVTSGYHSEA